MRRLATERLRTLLRLAPGLAGAALLLLVGSAASAQERRQAVPAELLQKAWDQGAVRVIVELGHVGAVSEGKLSSPAAVAAQRGRIASDQAAVRAALRGLPHRVLREFRTLPYVALEVDHDALRMLNALPGLATRVHEDMLLAPTLAQSGPLVRAPDAWAAGWDGSGQVIAILDTGVDKNHPFLSGKVVAEACYDSSGVSTCPNGLTEDTSAGAGMPCSFAPSDCSHGTHVAGIAAGNGPTLDGIARGASLIAIRVFHREDDADICGFDPTPCARAFWSDVLEGLEHVLALSGTHSIAAANLSLGGDWSNTPCDSEMPDMALAIANLRAAGIATVVASGNEGFLDSISFPACISTAVSVGATTDGSGGAAADLVAGFSNSAWFLSLLAPGYLINSSVPGEGFEAFMGTSMAAPHVAGAWAIAKQANPDFSVSDVLAGLQNTGRRILDVNGVTTSRIAATLLQFSATAYTASETAGTATITVTRTGAMFGPHFAPLTVDYATSADSAIPGVDYTETSGTLQFNAGETSKTFTVTVLNDTEVDGPRKVNLTLSSPGGGALLGLRDTAQLTIGDNDVGGSIQFAASAFSVNEQAGVATVTVTRTGGSAGPVTVQYETSDGTGHAGQDYLPASGTVTFDATGPGATTRTFTVTILDNGDPDGNRTVNLTLHTVGGGASLGGQKTASLTIVDNEVVLQFSQQAYSAGEFAGSATITVTRSGPTAPAASVSYTVWPGSATPVADYGGAATGVLMFGTNQTTRTFQIPIVNDSLAEGAETVLLQLLNPGSGGVLGPRQSATLTITDNDAGGAFRFGASSYSAPEGNAVAAVTVTRIGGSAGNGEVRIRTVPGGTAVPGTDYVPLDQVLQFATNQPSVTASVTLLTSTNLTVDAPRTIKLELLEAKPAGLASVAAPSSTTVVLVDNDAGGVVQLGPSSRSVLETDGQVVLDVTRTGGAAMGAGAAWQIVPLTAVHGLDYDGPTTGTVSFDGGPGQQITIPLLDRPGAHGTRTFQVKLTGATGGAKLGLVTTATVSILDETVGFRFDKASYPASEAIGFVMVSVLRTGPNQPGQVTLRSLQPPESGAGTAVPGVDYTPVQTPLTFTAFQSSRTVLVALKNDTALDGARTVTLVLEGPSVGILGEPSQATITVGDNDAAGTFAFTAGRFTATEGGFPAAVTLTVARTGGAGGPIEVPWSVTGGTATRDEGPPGPGVDLVVPATGVLQFLPNEIQKAITVTIVNDGDPEENEDLLLELGAPSPGGTLGAAKATRLVVIDNDRPGTIQFGAPLVSAAEADAAVTIPVTRAGNLTQAASVAWTVTGGSATPGDAPGDGVDYVAPTGGVLEFAPGQAMPTVPLTLGVRWDAVVDGTETVELALHTPSAPWVLGPTPSSTLSIVEGTVQFTGLPLTVSEASFSRTVTITRTGPATHPVTVSYAATGESATPAGSAMTCTAGADFRPVTGTLLFAPGQTTKTFSVPLCGDTVVEGNEDLTLTLAVDSGPAIVGPPGPAVPLTISENDLAGVVRFSSAAVSVSEGQANATLNIVRTATGSGVTVHWAIDTLASTAVHSVDFGGPLEGDIAFGTATSKPLAIPLVNTSAADGPRTIVVQLSDPQPAGLAVPGTPFQATVTIADNEPTVRLNSGTYTVGEAGATLNVTVMRSGPTTAPISVDLVPQAISGATGGTCGVGEADFSTSLIPVAIPAGVASKTVPVPICADTRAEGTESFGLALQAPVGATLAAPATATVTLTDDELGGSLRWGAADVSGVEGTTLVLSVIRSGGVASDVTVEVQAQDGDAETPGEDAVAGVDYQVLTSTPLVFAGGVLSQTVEISILPRNDVQGPRSFRVILQDPEGGAALGAPATATVWVLDGS